MPVSMEMRFSRPSRSSALTTNVFGTAEGLKVSLSYIVKLRFTSVAAASRLAGPHSWLLKKSIFCLRLLRVIKNKESGHKSRD